MEEERNESGKTTGGDGGDPVDANKGKRRREGKSIYSVLCLMIASILFPDPKTGAASISVLQRIRNSVAENGPDFREASSNTGRQILLWTRRGSPLRALFVITIGTIMLLTTLGLLIFMLFFLATTANAIIVSLLISVAAAGGFMALFFACVTAIYIGALSIAAFVISAATISAIVSALIVSGWIGFFWAMWMMARGGVHIAKQSVSVIGLKLSAMIRK